MHAILYEWKFSVGILTFGVLINHMGNWDSLLMLKHFWLRMLCLVYGQLAYMAGPQDDMNDQN